MALQIIHVWFTLDDKEEGDVSPKSNSSGGDSCKGKSALKSPVRASEGETMDDNPEFADVKEEDVKVPLHAQCANPVSVIHIHLHCHSTVEALRSKQTSCIVKKFVQAQVLD